ncbi:MAG: type II secretion system minor pseudopilin GspI [Magnetococcales bacterium]|nr:type II secretion system minor pseudopilin GspI [Magnetococcales bacterium]
MALTVLAISLGVMVTSSGRQAENSVYMRDKILAHWVAMNAVTTLHVMKSWPDTGTLEGHEEMANRDWSWTILVSSTPDATLRRLTISVRLGKEKKASPLVRLESYLGKP